MIEYRPSSELLARLVEEATGIERRVSPRLTRDAVSRAREKPSGHCGPILDELEHDGWDWGEVLGYNRFTPHPFRSVVASWMESPAHRAVLTDPYYRAVGAGAVRSRLGTRWDYCVIVGTRE